MAKNLIEICCHELKIVLGHFGDCCNLGQLKKQFKKAMASLMKKKRKRKNVFESSMERRLEFKM